MMPKIHVSDSVFERLELYAKKHARPFVSPNRVIEMLLDESAKLRRVQKRGAESPLSTPVQTPAAVAGSHGPRGRSRLMTDHSPFVKSNGKGRFTIFGNAMQSVRYAMGVRGWSGDKALCAMRGLGIDPKNVGSLHSHVSGGRSGRAKDKAATLSEEQWNELEAAARKGGWEE